jgi:hypothetical protein
MLAFKTLFFIGASLVSLTTEASSIALSKNKVFFDNNSQTRDIVEVKSLSPKQNVYFKTQLKEVLEPQKGTQSKYFESKDPSSLGLFITPNKAIITPGHGPENISIINTNKNLQKERVYRLDVIPVIPKAEGNGFGTQMTVLLAYDVLIHVQPENPIITHDFFFQDEEFHFHNTGNMHVNLKAGKQCNSQDECVDIPTGNLYSDSKVTIPLNSDTTYVEYEIVARGIKKENVIFKR